MPQLPLLPVPQPPRRWSYTLLKQSALCRLLDAAQGHGDRQSLSRPTPVAALRGVVVVSAACTRGQSAPKGGFFLPDSPAAAPPEQLVGSEGPHSMAAVAVPPAAAAAAAQPVSEGKTTTQGQPASSLMTWGTCHKGLLANISRKPQLSDKFDELVPYAVGGVGRDRSPGSAPPTGFLLSSDGGDRTTRSGDGGNAAAPAPPVVQVVSSHIHSLVLDAAGRAFAFGCGSGGRCGVEVSALLLPACSAACLALAVPTQVSQWRRTSGIVDSRWQEWWTPQCRPHPHCRAQQTLHPPYPPACIVRSTPLYLQAYLTGLHGARSRLKCYLAEPQRVGAAHTPRVVQQYYARRAPLSSLHVAQLASWRYHSAAVAVRPETADRLKASDEAEEGDAEENVEDAIKLTARQMNRVYVTQSARPC